MKTRRFQYEYRKSASKLHKKVGDTLRDGEIFKNYQIYQEYPVNRVNPSYPDSSHHFDWVIPDIRLVIECHGKQHYEMTDFSGQLADGGYENFIQLKARDSAKATAAIAAGWTYIVIRYDEFKEISEDLIYQKYAVKFINDQGNIPQLVPPSKQKVKPAYNKEKRQAYLKSDKHQETLRRAREYRRKQYDKAKARQLHTESDNDNEHS